LLGRERLELYRGHDFLGEHSTKMSVGNQSNPEFLSDAHIHPVCFFLQGNAWDIAVEIN